MARSACPAWSTSATSFQPYPTLIASAVAPLTQYGATGGYDPERVFFRCSAGDAVYEMFSTNGDDLYSGYYTGADTVGNDIGLQDAYRTAWPNVLLRLTNVETGKPSRRSGRSASSPGWT